MIDRSSTFEITVTGESMWPVLVPGKRYLARRVQEPVIGDIVVAIDPNDATKAIVKRIARIDGDAYQLTGTVSWSSVFTVIRAQILGVVVL